MQTWHVGTTPGAAHMAVSEAESGGNAHQAIEDLINSMEDGELDSELMAVVRRAW